MALPGSSGIDESTALQAMRCQIDPACSTETRNQARTWLEAALRESGAWNLLIGLLGTRWDATVQQQAAIYLKDKVGRDLASMSPEAVTWLLDVLFKVYTESPEARVRAQIGPCIARLLCSSEAHADVVSHAVSALGAHPLCQVELLTLLPAHAAAAEQERRTAVEASVAQHALSVLQRLAELLGGGGVPLLAGLRCFSAWVGKAPWPQALEAAAPFAAEALQHLGPEEEPALREACCEAASELAQLAGGGGPEGAPLCRQLAAALAARRADADEQWVRAATAVAVCVAPAMVADAHREAEGQPPLFPEAAELQAALLAAPWSGGGGAACADTAELTFPLWHALRSALREIDEVARQGARGVLQRQLYALVALLHDLYALPADERPEVWADADAARRDASAAVFRDVAWMMTPAVYLEKATEGLLKPRSDGRELGWRDVEVRLFGIACVGGLPGPGVWAEAAEGLLKAAELLPAGNARVQATYVEILPRLREYLRENPACLHTALVMCREALATTGAQALLRLCDACPRTIVASEAMLDTLTAAFDASLALPPDEQAAVAEGTGRVVWLLDEAPMAAMVERLVLPLLKRCENAFATGQEALLDSALAALAALLRTASEWCRQIVLDTRDEGKCAVVAGSWMSVWESLMRVLALCLDVTKTSERIAAQGCKCIGALVVVAGPERAGAHLANICELLVRGVQCFALPCFLVAVSEVTLAFAHVSDPANILVSTIDACAKAAIIALAPRPQEQPPQPEFADVELAKELFAMLASASEKSVLIGMSFRLPFLTRVPPLRTSTFHPRNTQPAAATAA